MSWNKAQCLADLHQNEELFKRVVASVVSYLETRARRLCDAYDNKDWEALRHEAHFLKGTSQQLHFSVLLSVTQRIEVLASRHRVDAALINEFKAEIAELNIELANC